ncbi:MAG: VC0807 family protein [Granulosicoccus sp.]
MSHTALEHKPRPFVDLIISIIIPSVILMKLSGDENLGATNALIFALAFPIGYGIYEFVVHKKRNGVAILGVISVLLTGGIGLLKIDPQWLAVKEAAIPLCIGIGVIVANKLGYPLVRKLIFNPTLMNIERIEEELAEKQNTQSFESRLDRANYFFAGTFLFSAIMNYVLAKIIVKSPGGTSEFNEELGRMTLLSYPVIAIPSMIMMLGIFWYIWRTVNRLTGLSLEEIMVSEPDKEDATGSDKTQ